LEALHPLERAQIVFSLDRGLGFGVCFALVCIA
jgi:hypothetical protein